MEPRQDRKQLLPEMQEHQHLSKHLGLQVSHPHLLVLPSHFLHSPSCFKKTQRRRRVGLESNICWILNIWMKLTKNLTEIHIQVGIV